MNLIGFISGMLLIFACTFSLSLKKAVLSQPVEKTFKANSKASRKILSSYESLCYYRLRCEKKDESKPHSAKAVQKKNQPIRHKNAECARLNLWPLITEGRETHPVLYETAAELLRAFYASALFPHAKKLEYTFLDALLAAAKEALLKDPDCSRLALETLSLKVANVKQLYTLQSLYYLTLKGTQTVTPTQGYPSLLDNFIIEKKESKLCLRHASIETLAALFGQKGASSLYAQIRESKVPLTPDAIRDCCRQSGRVLFQDSLFDWIDIDPSCRRLSGQKMLVEENSMVRMKKKVFLPS